MKSQQVYESKEMFKRSVSFETRKTKTHEMITNRDMIPTWIDFRGCHLLRNNMVRHKYLVQPTLTLSIFMIHLRKHAHLDMTQSMFALVNNGCPPMTRTISEIYEECKDDDGFLYITIKEENVFGN
jgi:hypothetical protein